MAYATYGELGTASQALIWALLRNDATLTTYVNASNIIDGIPYTLIQGIGFPYIVINGPSLNEEKLTRETRVKVDLKFAVDVYATQESILRTIKDRVRYVVSNAHYTTFLASGFVEVMIDFSDDVFMLSSHVNKGIWYSKGTLTMVWRGDRG